MDAMQSDLRSLGQLAADLQASVPRLERAIEQQRIEPAVRLNGIAYFSAAQVHLIQAALSHKKDRPMTNEEIQQRAAAIAYRGCSMIHGVAFTIDEHAAEPGALTAEQRTALSETMSALRVAHEQLGRLASVLHPGEYVPAQVKTIDISGPLN